MDEAAINGYLELLQWIHANCHEGCTALALHCTAVSRHASVVRWLDENVKVGNRHFLSAVRWGHLDVVKLLTKYCSDDASADLSRELTLARHRAEAEIRVLDTSGLLRARRKRIMYSQRIFDGPGEKMPFGTAVWRLFNFFFSTV